MSTTSLPLRAHHGPADACCSLHYSPEARDHMQQAVLAHSHTHHHHSCCCTLHNNPHPGPLLFSNNSSQVALLSKSQDSLASTNSQAPAKDFSFWMIFAAVCLSTLLVAIDLSIVSTALPSISEDLDAGELYVWVANAYVLSSTSVQPLFGQAANIFGRRSLTILSTVLFMVGSTFCGTASNVTMMIAGRTIQGIGGGGIITLGEIIICDLLPLRERGQYTGLIAGTYALGTIIGPVLGGVFTEQATWRWVFYLNLPLCAIALAIIIPFLRLKHTSNGSLISQLKRVDWIGNAILLLAITLILYSLSYGGTKYPWVNWKIILPLIFGFIFLGLFGYVQMSGWIPEPTMPRALFKTRTSVAVYAMAFIHGLLLLYVIYFFPVYSQAVLNASPIRAGVMLFPTATTIAPAAAAAGVMVTLTGKYRSLLWIGWIMMAIGIGLFPLLDQDSKTSAWVGYQALFGIGNGLVFNAMIPPLLASVGPGEIATATATWTFMRSFGSIWGIAIPSAIFNEKVNSLVKSRLPAVGVGGVVSAVNAVLQTQLLNGKAYEHATAKFVAGLNAVVKGTVVGIYVDSLKTVWYVAIACTVIGIPTCIFVRGLVLTNDYDGEFGIEEKKKGGGSVV